MQGGCECMPVTSPGLIRSSSTRTTPFVVRYEFSWSPWLTVKLGLATRRHIGEVLSNLVHLDLGLPARPQPGRADISRHHEVKPGCLAGGSHREARQHV